MTMVVRSEASPLAGYELFRTSDPSEAQESAMLVTAPHRLQVRGPEADFAATYRVVEVGPVTVCVQSYGAEVAMDRPGCDTCVSIVVPLMGEVGTGATWAGVRRRRW